MSALTRVPRMQRPRLNRCDVRFVGKDVIADVAAQHHGLLSVGLIKEVTRCIAAVIPPCITSLRRPPTHRVQRRAMRAPPPVVARAPTPRHAEHHRSADPPEQSRCPEARRPGRASAPGQPSAEPRHSEGPRRLVYARRRPMQFGRSVVSLTRDPARVAGIVRRSGMSDERIMRGIEIPPRDRSRRNGSIASRWSRPG